MITMNIIGDCVSRDICTPHTVGGNLRVLQYPGHASIVSIMGEKIERELSIEHLNEFGAESCKYFYKRSFVLDYNKTFIEYVFARKSNYLIVTSACSRMKMLKKGNHIVSDLKTVLEGFFENSEAIEKFELNKYEILSPYEIPTEKWIKLIERLCDTIMQNYRLDQIILHKHYGALEYEADGMICKFNSPDYIDNINKFNSLAMKIDETFQRCLNGCHIIEFPNNVTAKKGHQWGLCYLHYNDDYYKYASEALGIIFKALPEQKEREPCWTSTWKIIITD